MPQRVTKSEVSAQGEPSSVYRIRDMVKVRELEGTEFRLFVPQLDIYTGDKLALVGPSGCGKSTLLDILAMVLSPSSVKQFEFAPLGQSVSDVANIWSRNQQNKLSGLRKHHIGYVLQTGGLLPYMTVRENINLLCKLLSLDSNSLVEPLAQRLGIVRQLDKLPGMLSVGERQRVAIARALAHRPAIVIADEPTASLDPASAERIMRLFVELTEELGLTVIIASHDTTFMNVLGLRQLAHRFNILRAGSIVESVFME